MSTFFAHPNTPSNTRHTNAKLRVVIAGLLVSNNAGVEKTETPYIPDAPSVSAGAALGGGVIGMSELNMSTATFHEPSGCFFQTVVYLPLSVMVEPSGIVTWYVYVPSV